MDAEPTTFDGYDTLSEQCQVIALSEGEELADAVATDIEQKEDVLVVLDRTPFYAEMGGQVADHGYIVSDDAKLRVNQVKKTPKGYFVHTCTLLEGNIKVGDEVTASVDEGRRMSICRNHTATHLLQAALREVLGDHVHQAGSYQDDKITHFDFTHFSAVTPEELREVERRVNEKIFASLPVEVRSMPIDEAKKLGAMALFGEKYGEIVRVVDVCGWSTEFCGGTHVKNTAQIGCFRILSESSVAAGIRRIEATTGYGVLRLLDERCNELDCAARCLKVSNAHDPARPVWLLLWRSSRRPTSSWTSPRPPLQPPRLTVCLITPRMWTACALLRPSSAAPVPMPCAACATRSATRLPTWWQP